MKNPNQKLYKSLKIQCSGPKPKHTSQRNVYDTSQAERLNKPGPKKPRPLHQATQKTDRVKFTPKPFEISGKIICLTG